MSGDPQATDWWGFTATCKSAVQSALQGAGFNHGNRAADVAVKAVLKLINTSGAKLDRMYAALGGEIRYRERYLPPFAPICTVVGSGTVHNADFELLDTFDVRVSWSKDAREAKLTTEQRTAYLENILHARALLVAVERKAVCKYPDGFQVGIDNGWKELPENTRKEEE